jgi:hypothetical protein
MGFNKKRLPPLEEAKKMVAENKDCLNSFEKADAWIGPADTAHYLQEEIRKKYENESTTVPERGHAH